SRDPGNARKAGELCAARPSRRAAAHHVSRAPAQSQSRARRGAVMTLAAPAPREVYADSPARWTLPEARSYDAVNALVSAPLVAREAWTWRVWWIAFVISLLLTVVFLVCIYAVFARGLGIWGVNSTVVWGFAI